MNNFTKIVMPVLVVVFLLTAAIGITTTVTKENTLKQVAAAANTPVSNIETQTANNTPAPNYASQSYATNTQPVVSTPGPNAVSIPVNDYNNTAGVAQASCHGIGTQGTGETTGYGSSGCGGGGCGGNAGRTAGSPAAGPSSGASCH